MNQSGFRALNNIIRSFTLCLSLGCIFLCLGFNLSKAFPQGKKEMATSSSRYPSHQISSPSRMYTCLPPKGSSKSLTMDSHWLGLDPITIFGFSLTPADVSSRHHTDYKLGRGHPNGKSKCCSPKEKEWMLEKTSCGLLYYPSWSTFLKVLPMNMTSEDVGLAHITHLKVFKGIFSATLKSL